MLKTYWSKSDCTRDKQSTSNTWLRITHVMQLYLTQHTPWRNKIKGVKKYKYQLMEQVASMYKAFIRRKCLMHAKLNYESLPPKGSKRNLNWSMSTQLKFAIWRWMKTTNTRGRCDRELIHFHIKAWRTARSFHWFEDMPTTSIEHFNFSSIKDLQQRMSHQS